MFMRLSPRSKSHPGLVAILKAASSSTTQISEPKEPHPPSTAMRFRRHPNVLDTDGAHLVYYYGSTKSKLKERVSQGKAPLCRGGLERACHGACTLTHYSSYFRANRVVGLRNVRRDLTWLLDRVPSPKKGAFEFRRSRFCGPRIATSHCAGG